MAASALEQFFPPHSSKIQVQCLSCLVSGGSPTGVLSCRVSSALVVSVIDGGVHHDKVLFVVDTTSSFDKDSGSDVSLRGRKLGVYIVRDSMLIRDGGVVLASSILGYGGLVLELAAMRCLQ